MKKVILYIAQSLDGYVATKDGSVAWLDEFNKADTDYGYNEFIKNIDTCVQGDTTYQQFKHLYEGKNNYIFASDAESRSLEGATFVKGGIKEFVDSLDEKTHKNIWLVGGPNLAKQFFNEGYIDEMIIFTMPVLLNDGISLFNNLTAEPRISLKDIKKYDNGVVVSHYTIKRKI